MLRYVVAAIMAGTLAHGVLTQAAFAQSAGSPSTAAVEPTDTIVGDKARMERAFSYIIGMQTGNGLRKQLPTAVDDIDIEAMMQGIKESLAGERPRLDVAEMAFWSGKFLKMLDDRKKAKKGINLIDGKAFRDEYATRNGVSATASGILYRELKAGSGKQPGFGQSVLVHYRGTFINGTEFDSSIARGEPTSLRVRDVIPGWQEILTLMPAGAKWEAVIPPELAYGEAGAGDVGPNETLIFELEIIEVQ
jgi:FKBP-type peptidyl-prolyl cis-trans isomerase